MSLVHFGDFLVRDLNENDLWDTGVDQLLDAKANPLSPLETKQKLQSILQELEIPKLQGVLLSKAAECIKHYRQAEAQAELGNPEFTDYSLGEAWNLSRAGNFAFNWKKSDALTVKALKGGIARLLAQATEEAELGLSPDLIRGYLENIQQFSRALAEQFQENSRISSSQLENIEKRALVTRFERLKRDLETESKNNFYDTEHDMSEIATVQAEANRYFSLGLYLGDDWRREIWRQAFAGSIEELFVFAERHALLGQTQSSRHYLFLAFDQGARAKREHGFIFQYDRARADRILETALVEGVEANYKVALNYAKKGDIAKAEHWLQQGEGYVREYNLRFSNLPGRQRHFFDKRRAQAILVCGRYPQTCSSVSE